MSTIVTRAGKGSALTHNEVDANFTNLNTDKVEKSGTDPIVISANSASDALRITQTGTGNVLVVEDSANPDSTPFVIDASGMVGIGTSSPAQKLHIVGDVLFEDGSPILTMKDSNATGSSYGGYIDFVDSTDARQGYIGFGSTSNANLTIQSTDASGQIIFSIGGATRANITSTGNLQFNSGYGSVATAYGCRAWVNFNGTGTVAIRASGNVSSITDNGTGDYTVNFTNAMPDANYSAAAQANTASSYGYTAFERAAKAAGSYRVQCATTNAYTVTDCDQVTVSIFR